MPKDRIPLSSDKPAKTQSKGAKKADKKRPRRSALMTAAAWGVTLALWMIVLGGGAIAFFAWDLPSLDNALAATRKPVVLVVDRNGRQIARFGERRGEAIGVEDMPPYLVQAVIATEDRRFFEHFGVDILGIGRAALANLRAGRIVQGGSTITQQAAKNLFLSSERSFKRKIQEVLLALSLEERFTKNQILALYLNRVYFGSGTYGIDAASQAYFGVPARDMTLRQATVIAGLLKAPSRLSPLTNPQGASARADEVLDNMVEAGFLNAQARSSERNQPWGFKAPTDERRIARYFLDWVLEQLDDYVGPEPGDIVIKTTLDADLQIAAETELANMIAQSGAAANVEQGAALVMTTDGAVRAMVGGKNYGESQFNRAVQALRQPGSSFKPIIYEAGLEIGVGTEQIFIDQPINIGGWKPSNFDEKFRGQITTREALAQSINTVAVQIADKAGMQRIISVARRLGLTTKLPPDLSLALGSGEVTLLELTSAYGTFANGGNGVWAHGIEEIDDAQGNVLYKREGDGPGRVLEATDAAMMNSMMAGVIEHGTGTAAKIGRPAAGKTGTSSDFRDAWFMGFSRDLVGGVWLGNDDNHPMKRVTGGGLPARLWQKIMVKAHQGIPIRPLYGTDVPAPVTASAPAWVDPDKQTQKIAQEGSFWDRLKNVIGIR
jgi:penicillin-binding protein 1A